VGGGAETVYNQHLKERAGERPERFKGAKHHHKEKFRRGAEPKIQGIPLADSG